MVKKHYDYCNEIMQAVRMAEDKSIGSLDRWIEKYGKGAYLCSITCSIIKQAMKKRKRKVRK